MSLKKSMRAWFRRFAGLFRRRQHDAEFAAELESHLWLHIEDNLRAGMTPEAARRDALMKLGGVEQTKEKCRDMRRVRLIETTLQDIRFGFRVLRKNPGFTVVAVLTLALGIGLNTTLFSVFNAVALKPVPVRNSARLVRLERWFASNRLGEGQYAFSYAEFRSFEARNRVLSNLVAVSFPFRVAASLPVNASTSFPAKIQMGAPESATTELVSANYFGELGVTPAVGRLLLPEEGRAPGVGPVVVLSYSYWRARLGGDAGIIGKVLELNSTAFTVVGVASSDFMGTGNPPVIPDFWAPISMQAQVLPGQDWLNQPLDYEFQLIGHLEPAIEMKEAGAQLSVLEHNFAQDHPNRDNETTSLTVQRATLFGNTEDFRFKAVVTLLMVIVGMVLMIACANLANMQLAKASGRQREIAVRLALGAGRQRLVRQLLTESTLLALAGGAGGVFLSLWGTRALWLVAGQFAGPYSAFVTQIKPDVRVLTYTLLLSLCTGVFFGMSPALQGSRPNLTTALKDAGTAFGQRLDRSRMRGLLVGGQMALSTLFLIVAGLLARGMIRAQTSDPGFEVRTVFPLGLLADTDRAKGIALRQNEIARLQALPMIQNVAWTDFVPFNGTWSTQFEPGDSTKVDPHELSETLARHVSSAFFNTLGIPILRGREFTQAESQSGAAVAIVSNALARGVWPGEDPLGKKIKLQTGFGGERNWLVFEVVGVAGDVRSANISRLDPAIIYLPTSSKNLNDYEALLRVPGDPREARQSVATLLEQLDGRQRPGFLLLSLEDDAVRAQLLMARTFAMAALCLAALAMLLASIGVYGVTAFLVSQREKEVGIHMALGASRSKVLGLMLTQGMRPVLFGGALGLVGALSLSGFMRALLYFPGSVDVLYGARWFDPATFALFSCVLGVVALLACYVPARRAMCVDPVVALRYE